MEKIVGGSESGGEPGNEHGPDIPYYSTRVSESLGCSEVIPETPFSQMGNGIDDLLGKN